MTAKEKLHRLVDELSEQEADSAIELIVSRHRDDSVDAWGDLSTLHGVTTSESMRRLAGEERAAGHDLW